MTFTCKCECGAILMIVVDKVSEVIPTAEASGWRLDLSKAPYRAWTDTVPAFCDKHNETQAIAGKSPA